jgi:hypothetical protein
MPPRSSRGRRKDRHVNVFVQQDQPSGAEAFDDSPDPIIDEDEADSAVVARPRRTRAQRVSRQARARSEVYTRTLGKEMRKVGILSGAIVITLVVLTFVLK